MKRDRKGSQKDRPEKLRGRGEAFSPCAPRTWTPIFLTGTSKRQRVVAELDTANHPDDYKTASAGYPGTTAPVKLSTTTEGEPNQQMGEHLQMKRTE